MRSELLGQEKNIVKVKIEFDAADFMANLNETIGEITQKANVPGFRKGRIPRKIIEMRFGKDNLYNEAIEKMLPDALKQVIEDYDLDVLGNPSIKIGEVHEGEPVSCELVFEVKPEVEMPELEDIEVERLRQTVNDETLDTMTDELRKKFATVSPVERVAGENDVVFTSFVTRVLNPNGDEPPTGEPQIVEIDLADPTVRVEVKNALMGKGGGDEVTTEFDIEPNYKDASLAGKRVRYDIKVNSVNEKVLPDIGPEFFKKVFETDLDTEADFRKELKDRLLAHQESEETTRVREEAITAIVARSNLDVPDSLMQRQTANVKEQDAIDIKRRFDLSVEDYLGKVSISHDQYEQAVRGKAEALLRRMLVLEEISKKFDIEVSKEELEAEISRLAVLHGMERAKVRSHYYKDEDNMSQLSNGLRYDKINKLILEKITVKEVDKLSIEEPAGDENSPPVLTVSENSE